MSYLRDNLKTIRKVWNKNQGEFASLFVGVDEDNQKSYERKQPSVPDIVYLNRLTEITGINQNILMGRAIAPNEVPEEPITNNDKVKKVNRGTSGSEHDSKEGVLRMLEKSLDANIKHANANEKNADNLTWIVKVVAAKFNLGEIEKVSEPFQEGGVVRLNPTEQTDAFLGKRVDALEKMIQEMQKGNSF